MKHTALEHVLPPESNYPEPYLTVKDAARRLGLPAFKLQRAARAGLVPTYSFFNKRKLVRLSEVVAFIERSRAGGQQ